MMRIDGHQHFWRLADRGGAWPPSSLAAIYRDFLPHQLQPLMQQHGVAATVLVQSMPNEDDSRFMLDLAARFPFIGAVVGWVDMKLPDAPERIAALAVHDKLRGLRPMLQDIDDELWIDDVALTPAVEAMLRHSLTFDALVLPRHLPALLAFACRHRELPIVIDHAAKPAIGGAGLGSWQADMARLAALPNVYCKLSGLANEAGPGWTVDGLRPCIDHILDSFGPRRVIWGSDWPVLGLVADYGRWIAACDAALAGLNQSERDAIYGENARIFYRIK
jgi:L-fuconolactonase